MQKMSLSQKNYWLIGKNVATLLQYIPCILVLRWRRAKPHVLFSPIFSWSLEAIPYTLCPHSLKASAAILRGVPLKNMLWLPQVHGWESGLGHLQKGLAGSFRQSGDS